MTYDTLIYIINMDRGIKISYLEEIIGKEFQDFKEDDSIEAIKNIYNILDLVTDKQLIGDDDDYHNIAVIFARNEYYKEACEFLEKGIEIYPNDVDLLADYLIYGVNANKYKRCEELFVRLENNRELWNWRGYQFSIDYLRKRLSIEEGDKHEETLAKIDQFTNDFLKVLPYKEEAYKCRAEYLQLINTGRESHDRYVEMLELAISEKSILKRAPKCELKLADEYYDIGEIEKANQVIENCKISSLEIQQSVNRVYLYSLSVLCKISLYYRYVGEGTKRYYVDDNDVKKGEMIDSIYNDFHVVARYNDKKVKSVKEILESFIRETGKPYPYDDDINID